MIKGRRQIEVSPVDTDRMLRYERRSVSFGVNHRHGWPAKDGRPSMRRRWQAEPTRKKISAPTVSRSSALPSWSVSRKPSRYWARDVSFSRQSSGLVDFRAARRSPPKSGAIGNQFIFMGSLLPYAHIHLESQLNSSDYKRDFERLFYAPQNLRPCYLKKGFGPAFCTGLIKVRSIECSQTIKCRWHKTYSKLFCNSFCCFDRRRIYECMFANRWNGCQNNAVALVPAAAKGKTVPMLNNTLSFPG